MTLCYITESSCYTACNLKYCDYDKLLRAYCCTDDIKASWQMWFYISIGILVFMCVIIDAVVCMKKKQDKQTKYKKVVKVQKPGKLIQYVGEHESVHNEVDQFV
ncbi:Hypothetical_protein [Hexamita inflata]|uniref:Hypothetical_protein n=1 Tax=Hexamita inflata TaxID=28002 RepID=A0AA86UVR4_9EUKA|nr:Hypothetical protein HINF_LOCUS54419 [Hexamita inflata]CAI9966777.1 Hypothetical protein HINF_LOCUS54422 [Hexamita inflata]